MLTARLGHRRCKLWGHRQRTLPSYVAPLPRLCVLMPLYVHFATCTYSLWRRTNACAEDVSMAVAGGPKRCSPDSNAGGQPVQVGWEPGYVPGYAAGWTQSRRYDETCQRWERQVGAPRLLSAADQRACVGTRLGRDAVDQASGRIACAHQQRGTCIVCPTCQHPWVGDRPRWGVRVQHNAANSGAAPAAAPARVHTTVH